jgi:hypothetical protein
MINAFLEKCRPNMRDLVAKAGRVASFLPSWKPSYSTDGGELTKHISRLCIPVGGGQPSLLLHDLGEERDDLDRQLVDRILNIFSFEKNT